MSIERTPEWQLSKTLLEPIHAKRSGISYFEHIREGVEILKAIGAPLLAQQAFALHPIIQKTEDFAKNFDRLAFCDCKAVALAVEYRWVANLGVRAIVKANNWEVMLAELPLVNQMLIADKVQNRKDFRAYFDRAHPDYEDLDRYFNAWLRALGVTEESYRKLVNAL
jgi:hypothetical protein